MADLSKETVLRVASLARLNLAPGEVELFTRQLSAILDFFADLSRLDTAGVEPTSHVVPVTNRFRDDAIVASPAREEMMSNAPDAAEGHYRVPRIIGEEE